MRIVLVTPASRGSRKGNRTTALRWARILRKLGHRVEVRERYQHGRFDLLIALHAVKSFPSIERFHDLRPGASIVVGLTGTDIYGGLTKHPEGIESLRMASQIIALQPLAIRALPRELQIKARTIFQSVERPRDPSSRPSRRFEVCVLGHLRQVKDPFRAALAARRLPADSRIVIRHAGGALESGMTKAARQEMRRNVRYEWLGEISPARTLQLLQRSQLLVLSSRSEGGANVVSEAIACGVPVLASRISGSVGILGADYPGYFPFGNTARLTALLRRAERDCAFYDSLKRHIAGLRPLVSPEKESQEWEKLIAALPSSGGIRRSL